MSSCKGAVFKQNYISILSLIIDRIPYAYNHLCFRNDIEPEELKIKEILSLCDRFITNNKEEIFIETYKSIDRYLNDFSITPSDSIDNIDEFKIIFFLSKTLYNSLKIKA